MTNNYFNGEINDEAFEDVIEEEEGTIDSLECDDGVDLYEYDDDLSTGDYVIINLVETWKEQQTADRVLKTKYGKWIMAILIIEFIFMSGILVLIGLGKLSFEEWVINAFIVTTFGQIMGVVYLIVKNLFSDGNQIIDIIKEYIK